MDSYLSTEMQSLSLNSSQHPNSVSDILISGSTDWNGFEDGFQKQEYQKRFDRLHYVLKKQSEERNDTSFSRDCLFCRKHFTQNRSFLFKHLLVEHNFYLGSLDNIVFANELLDAISEKLENLQCVYCEKTFKDWNVLKEHMRKKWHKRISPKNKKYDVFYIQNYKKLCESPSQVIEEEKEFVYSGAESDDDEEDAYMECQDEDAIRDQECVCLLCPETLPDFDRTLIHMKRSHNFDFMALKRLHRLDFYKQVKLCNYYRSQMSSNSCPLCSEKFPTHSAVLNHMVSSGHVTQLPDMRLWDLPTYYALTRDSDNFLCFLDDENDDNTLMDEPVVLPEDIATSWDPFLLAYSCEEMAA